MRTFACVSLLFLHLSCIAGTTLGQETKVSAGHTSAPFQTFVSFQTQLGTRALSGFKNPWTSYGPAIEVHKGGFETSGLILWSPTNKVLTNDGHSLWLDFRVLYWIKGSRFAIGGGALYKRFISSQFVKRGWEPGPVFSIRDMFLGVPTRWTFSYLLPTGSSTKALQDPRGQGLRFEMDGIMTKHLMLGFTYFAGTFLDQGNPAFPNLRKREFAGEVMAKFTIVLPGRSVDKAW
jgi:hypothetical protein